METMGLTEPQFYFKVICYFASKAKSFNDDVRSIDQDNSEQVQRYHFYNLLQFDASNKNSSFLILIIINRKFSTCID